MTAKPVKIYRFASLLTQKGWMDGAHVALDDHGCILDINAHPMASDGSAFIPVEVVDGFAIAGFQNGHSHAFQYAMVGIAEHLAPAALHDDFWTWREAMYRLALRLTPDEMEAIATLLYAEMLRHGITAVTEFHYLHHDPAGKPYNHLAEMGARLIAAAEKTGIHITLVPVMYEQGGFGKPLHPGQIRFRTSGIDGYEKLLQATRKVAHHYQDAHVGIGIHSLRAVSPQDTLTLLRSTPDHVIHMHVAEQRREVEDCVHQLGKRPVEWLLEHLPLDRRFHLVHATHMIVHEATQLAKSKATVVVCPSTEGNLGDGIFPLKTFRSHGGGCAIGTDSQIGLSPLEDLRWLDYVQRLSAEKRNIVCQKGGEDSATLLLSEAWRHGRSAMGQSCQDFFAVGQTFDAVIIDPQHPVMLGKPAERRLGALIYGGDSTCFLGTMRRGRWLVRQGLHTKRDQFLTAYRPVVEKLWTT